jgi:NitT/TauT family transport system substrate-binding protein
MIKNNPKLVRKFLKATLKGVEYTVRNPSTALESILKRDLTLSKEVERKRLDEYNQVTSITKEYYPGYMDIEMFQETYSRLKEERVLAGDFNVSDVFTTQFLDEIYS